MTSARGSLDARWESSATDSAAWPPRAARSARSPDAPQRWPMEKGNCGSFGGDRCLVERAARGVRELQRGFRERCPILDVELQGLGKIDHDACDLAVRGPGEHYRLHLNALTINIDLGEPELLENLGDAHPKTRNQRGNWSGRNQDGQKRLLAHSQDELASLNMNQIRVPVSETGRRTRWGQFGGYLHAGKKTLGTPEDEHPGFLPADAVRSPRGLISSNGSAQGGREAFAVVTAPRRSARSSHPRPTRARWPVASSQARATAAPPLPPAAKPSRPAAPPQTPRPPPPRFELVTIGSTEIPRQFEPLGLTRFFAFLSPHTANASSNPAPGRRRDHGVPAPGGGWTQSLF